MKTGKQVWDRLKKVYESAGFSRVASLIEQLVIIRYKECKDMMEYLSKKVKIAQQLKSIDNDVVKQPSMHTVAHLAYFLFAQ